MLPIFKQYLDNFYLSISGIWCLCIEDVREKILKDKKPATLDTSLPNKETILVNLYELSQKLPKAPFNNQTKVNNYIEIQGRLLIIVCFDWLKVQLGWKRIIDEPKIIQLFKHLRDASAHDNCFYLKDERFLPLQWQNKNLTIKDNGKPLFSRWMSLGDIEYFLEDVSIEVKSRINH